MVGQPRCSWTPIIAILGALAAASAQAAVKPAQGSLSENRIIQSSHLGYALQYRVYLPAGHDKLSKLPVLYLTDGQWYIESGELPHVLDRLIGTGKIKPVIAVFVDNREPGNLSINRRNQQFFCNRDYVRFVSEELVGKIDRTYPTQSDRSGRTILGLSFGGLNSACFGLYARETFYGIAMQSPATHPVPSLYADYKSAPKADLKIALTTGTVENSKVRTRHFRKVLKQKGYEPFYKEVPFGHEWANWGPLLDDLLLFYFAVE